MSSSTAYTPGLPAYTPESWDDRRVSPHLAVLSGSPQSLPGGHSIQSGLSHLSSLPPGHVRVFQFIRTADPGKLVA